MIGLLAAVDCAWGIGKDGSIPWKSDLAFVRQITLGHTVIMGRRTYESIGHPLPGRTNIVVSSENFPGTTNAKSVREAIDRVQGNGFLLGGAEIYREGLQYCDQAIVTFVRGNYDCDTVFPCRDLFARFGRPTRWVDNRAYYDC